MARPRSHLNRFADGLLKILADDAAANPALWFKVPATFHRGVGPEVLDLAKPVVCVSLNGSIEPIKGPMEQNTQTSQLTLSLAAVLDDNAADEAVGEMWADLVRVLLGNRQLTAVDDPDAPTITGYSSIGGTRFASRDGSSGDGTIEMDVTIRYTWSTSAP